MKGTKSDRETLRTRVKEALGDGTQKDLEQTLGVSGGTLSRVFGGRRNVDADFLRALAEAIGVDVRRLLHGTDFLLLFDEDELPREAGEIDVVAPVPPPPAPVASPASSGGATAEPGPDASNSEDPDADGATAEPPPNIADLDTEPTIPVVEAAKPSDSSTVPSPERRTRDTVPVDEPVPPPSSSPGIGRRIRRFLSSLFGG